MKISTSFGIDRSHHGNYAKMVICTKALTMSPSTLILAKARLSDRSHFLTRHYLWSHFTSSIKKRRFEFDTFIVAGLEWRDSGVEMGTGTRGSGLCRDMCE